MRYIGSLGICVTRLMRLIPLTPLIVHACFALQSGCSSSGSEGAATSTDASAFDGSDGAAVSDALSSDGPGDGGGATEAGAVGGDSGSAAEGTGCPTGL